MSKRNDGQARGKYTLKFKLEAMRPVKGWQAAPVTARILGVAMQTLGDAFDGHCWGGPGTLLGPVLGAGMVVLLKNLASAYTER